MTKTKHAPATSSRRGLLMGLAASAAVPTPALTTALKNADPILAAIDAHKAAMRSFSDVVTEEEKLEERLPAERRRSTLSYEFETDDPLWIANKRAWVESNDHLEECALALLDNRPTTAAGMASLFLYVAGGEEWVFPDDVLMEDDSDDGVDFQTALLLTAAKWLAETGVRS
jgi:hypothetical protein